MHWVRVEQGGFICMVCRAPLTCISQQESCNEDPDHASFIGRTQPEVLLGSQGWLERLGLPLYEFYHGVTDQSVETSTIDQLRYCICEILHVYKHFVWVHHDIVCVKNYTYMNISYTCTIVYLHTPSSHNLLETYLEEEDRRHRHYLRHHHRHQHRHQHRHHHRHHHRHQHRLPPNCSLLSPYHHHSRLLRGLSTV